LSEKLSIRAHHVSPEAHLNGTRAGAGVASESLRLYDLLSFGGHAYPYPSPIARR